MSIFASWPAFAQWSPAMIEEYDHRLSDRVACFDDAPDEIIAFAVALKREIEVREQDRAFARITATVCLYRDGIWSCKGRRGSHPELCPVHRPEEIAQRQAKARAKSAAEFAARLARSYVTIGPGPCVPVVVPTHQPRSRQVCLLTDDDAATRTFHSSETYAVNFRETYADDRFYYDAIQMYMSEPLEV